MEVVPAGLPERIAPVKQEGQDILIFCYGYDLQVTRGIEEREVKMGKIKKEWGSVAVTISV